MPDFFTPNFHTAAVTFWQKFKKKLTTDYKKIGNLGKQ